MVTDCGVSGEGCDARQGLQEKAVHELLYEVTMELEDDVTMVDADDVTSTNLLLDSRPINKWKQIT
ncbi:hypothetical protein E2C01_052792 [Portunus trituberculatus]|uniref:Uncharacterized protein n=1 Tax=Portunus trituberculatus TaxID=210409 RepID=A0A5B7GMN9_PORTR|nr:hypothetical protein [Portunus trituberculatus]